MFTSDLVASKHTLRDSGDLRPEEARWLEAVEPYADRELYGIVLSSSEEGWTGWIVVDPSSERVVCWQRYGWEIMA